jgi:Family of unknown function (DUF5302)
MHRYHHTVPTNSVPGSSPGCDDEPDAMMDAGRNEGALMPEAPDTSAEPTADATDTVAPDAAPDATSSDANSSDAISSDDGVTVGAPEDLRSSFRDALARKAGRNSHVESHLDGRHLGSGNNDTRKRQFRRKSGG